MKIGIFGGSFNPVHTSHISIAGKLIEKGITDKIIFVPVGNFYEKPELISFNNRLTMLKLATQNNKSFYINDFENQNKRIYTFETLDYFKARYPEDEIFLIIGSDNLKQILLWKEPDYILTNYRIITLLRDVDKASDFKQFEKYKIIFIEEYIGLSSSKIRELLKLKKFTEVKKYLAYQVFEYIKDKGLYL